MAESEKMRAFVAVDFPDVVIKEVARVQKILRKKKFEGKMTELENLHLTLKFLGRVEEGTLENVRKKLREVNFEEMDLNLSDIGTFSYKGRPRIVWVKVGGKGIFELQGKIDDALEGFFEREKRFMSHMTIARVKFVKDKKEFVDYVEEIGLKGVKFNVGSFRLMKSELKKLGPVYSVIEEYKSGN